VLALPAVLYAHARLTSSSPAEGARLTEAPTEIRLTFSERPSIAIASVVLVHGRDSTSLEPLTVDTTDRKTVTAPIPGALSPGSYEVVWRVSSRDGHPIRGAYSFAVQGTAADTLAVALVPAPKLVDEESESSSMAVGGAIGAILVRWLGFISIFLVIGAVTFKRFVLDRMDPSHSDTFLHIGATNAATLGIFAAIGTVIGTLLKFARESSDMPDVSASTLLFGSTWGIALFMHLVAGVLAGIAFKAAHSPSDATRRTAWTAAFAVAMVLGITPAFGGHAVAGDRVWLAVPADVIHVIAGSAWLGTLTVILIVGIPAALKTPDDSRPGARVARMINVFSPLALMCGGSVVATGLGASVIRLPRVSALWTSPYGVILLIKLLFVVFLFAAGAWNWRRLKPRLTGDDAISPLRSSAWFEVVLSGIVLGFTAILVALELP
jgi:copper transport protein